MINLTSHWWAELVLVAMVIAIGLLGRWLVRRWRGDRTYRHLRRSR